MFIFEIKQISALIIYVLHTCFFAVTFFSRFVIEQFSHFTGFIFVSGLNLRLKFLLFFFPIFSILFSSVPNSYSNSSPLHNPLTALCGFCFVSFFHKIDSLLLSLRPQLAVSEFLFGPSCNFFQHLVVAPPIPSL